MNLSSENPFSLKSGVMLGIGNSIKELDITGPCFESFQENLFMRNSSDSLVAIHFSCVRVIQKGAFKGLYLTFGFRKMNSKIDFVMNFSGVQLEKIETGFSDTLSRFDVTDLSKNFISSIGDISGLATLYSSASSSNDADLSVLNISQNRISRLDQDTFTSYSYLKVLDISWNNIPFIDPGVFGPGNIMLKSLDLTGNPTSILDRPCPNDYRKIFVNFSLLIRYPACVKLRIIGIIPAPLTYQLLPDGFELQIQAEGLDMDLNNTIVTLNGYPCLEFGFLNAPDYKRV
jgi:hypothetical protein